MDGLVHGIVMNGLGLGGMVHGLILGGVVDFLGPGLLDEDLLLFIKRKSRHR